MFCPKCAKKGKEAELKESSTALSLLFNEHILKCKNCKSRFINYNHNITVEEITALDYAGLTCWPADGDHKLLYAELEAPTEAKPGLSQPAHLPE